MATSKRLAVNVLSGVLTNVTRIGLQAILLPLMANLLGPSELGVYALALPIISFVMLLSDAGLGDSLAREKTDDHLVWSSAFWALLVGGVVLMGLVWLASVAVAHFASQPRLPEIIFALSFTLLMVVVSVIPNARLLRQGNLVPNAAADLAGNILGAVVGISMALLGFGVWSMVTLYVTTYTTRAIVLNAASPFLPRLKFSLRSLFSHTGMGSQILSTRLMDLLTRMFENSQVSRKLGAAALGGYSYANQIGYFAANAVGNPLWANLYYIAINRSKAEVSAHYIHSHRIFSLIVFPASTVLALAMPALVPIVFGHEWLEAIPSIMIMVLATPFGNLGAFQTAVLFAQNRGGLVVMGLGVTMVFRILVVLLAWPFGIFGLSVGLAVTNVLYFVGTIVFIAPIIGVPRLPLLRVIASPLLASVACGAAFAMLAGPEASLLRLIGAGALSLPVYLLSLLLFDFRLAISDLKSAAGILGLNGKLPVAGVET
ncbi:oligosaccharide flippase family protein [Rhizobium sp. P32RR-XVIII]|uniref:oligosaccharide flippase family protein n=1 Tax=Rhizobium sp. P32RR-XVIII TaxID=2726738 RepID=UPI001456A9A2|nr:oligosaccharide flippase family protein [Rhizobium sp. P32RR-XVIII]NLS03712.1 oligosaccharide flippase family protein [Rhizobium sp. P32RR-XVIII]